MRPSCCHRRGVSYVEMMVAVALFSAAFLYILDFSPRLKHAIGASRQHRLAVVVAENQMEILHARPLSALAGQGWQPIDTAAGSLKELPLSDASGFQVEWEAAGFRVDLELVWGPPERRQKYQLHTIIPRWIQP